MSAAMKFITLVIAILALAIPAALLMTTPASGLIAERDSAAPAPSTQQLASR